jgi:hypothetical protein
MTALQSSASLEGLLQCVGSQQPIQKAPVEQERTDGPFDGVRTRAANGNARNAPQARPWTAFDLTPLGERRSSYSDMRRRRREAPVYPSHTKCAGKWERGKPDYRLHPVLKSEGRKKLAPILNKQEPSTVQVPTLANNKLKPPLGGHSPRRIRTAEAQETQSIRCSEPMEWDVTVVGPPGSPILTQSEESANLHCAFLLHLDLDNYVEDRRDQQHIPQKSEVRSSDMPKKEPASQLLGQDANIPADPQQQAAPTNSIMGWKLTSRAAKRQLERAMKGRGISCHHPVPIYGHVTFREHSRLPKHVTDRLASRKQESIDRSISRLRKAEDPVAIARSHSQSAIIRARNLRESGKLHVGAATTPEQNISKAETIEERSPQFDRQCPLCHSNPAKIKTCRGCKIRLIAGHEMAGVITSAIGGEKEDTGTPDEHNAVRKSSEKKQEEVPEEEPYLKFLRERVVIPMPVLMQ